MPVLLAVHQVPRLGGRVPAAIPDHRAPEGASKVDQAGDCVGTQNAALVAAACELIRDPLTGIGVYITPRDAATEARSE